MKEMMLMIKYVILGFLTNKCLTGYDIKQIMMQNTSSFLNASFGSIYPALEKLEKEKLVSSSNVSEHGKVKKVYEIKEAGKDVFIEWLVEPIDFMKSYEEILAKVFFYAELPKEKAMELIDELLNNINKKIQHLKATEGDIKWNLGFFEASTLDFSIDHLKFTASWYEKFLQDISKR